MSVTSRLVSGFKVEFLARLLTIVASGVLTVALARLLAANEYGLLFLAISVLTALSSFSNLGIANSAARYIAEFKNEEPGQIPHIIKVSLLFNLTTISIVCGVLFVFHEYIASAIGEPALGPLLALGVFYIVFSTLVTYARHILQGYEAIKYAAILKIIDRTSNLVFAIGFVLLGLGVYGALAGYILAYAISSTVGLVFVFALLYDGIDAAPAIKDDLTRRIAEYTVPLTATNAANVLDKQLDTILVAFFLNPLAVSFYIVGKQVVEFIKTPMTALGFALSPTLGAEKASGNAEEAARLYESALTHSLLVYIPAGAGLFLVAEPTVVFIFGPDYAGAVPVLQVFAAYAVLRAVTKITSHGLDYLGRAKARAIVKGITSVLNVILNVILIPTIGVVGAAIATVITYGMYTVANVFIVHLEFGLRTRFLAVRLSQILLVTAGMAAVVYPAMAHVNGLVTLFGVVALGGAVWLGLSTVTGLLDVEKAISIATGRMD